MAPTVDTNQVSLSCCAMAFFVIADNFSTASFCAFCNKCDYVYAGVAMSQPLLNNRDPRPPPASNWPECVSDHERRTYPGFRQLSGLDTRHVDRSLSLGDIRPTFSSENRGPLHVAHSARVRAISRDLQELCVRDLCVERSRSPEQQPTTG